MTIRERYDTLDAKVSEVKKSVEFVERELVDSGTFAIYSSVNEPRKAVSMLTIRERQGALEIQVAELQVLVEALQKLLEEKSIYIYKGPYYPAMA